MGQTVREERRKSDHKLAAKDTPFHKAIQKYGYDSFEYVVLHKEIVSIDEMNRLEEEEIERLSTCVPNGYNLKSGGRNNLLNEATKEKIRKKALGRVISKETRQKLSTSHKGHIMSEGTKEKIRHTLKGRDKGQDFRDKMKSIRSLPEMKKAVSEVHTGTRRTGLALRNLREGHFTQRIICTTTGKIYNSIKEASIDTGVNSLSITRDAKGLVIGRKYRWKYA